MIDKVLAERLRSEGLQYSEIAQQLGCSESWCKLYLKGVQKGERVETDGAAMKLRAICILEKALDELRGI